MNTQDRFESLERIKQALLFYASHVPDDVAKKYGTKNLNIAIQDSKKLLSDVALELLSEDAKQSAFYETDCMSNSLGIVNIN